MINKIPAELVRSWWLSCWKLLGRTLAEKKPATSIIEPPAPSAITDTFGSTCFHGLIRMTDPGVGFLPTT